MKRLFLILTLTSLFSSLLANEPDCDKDCSLVPADKKEACLDNLLECQDQKLVNQIIFCEKNGVSKDNKIRLLQELNKTLDEVNSQFSKLQLRRAMYKKLKERSEKLILIQE